MEITPLASGSTGNCYRIDCAGRTLLIECGIRYPEIQRGLGFQVSKLDGCLISHEHGDHSKAVKQMMKAGVDCFMSAGTLTALFPERPTSSHRAIDVEPLRTFYPGSNATSTSYWQVLPFETQHDAAEPLGFLIARAGRKLLYATDTFYLKYRFEGLTHVMLEINYAEDILAERVAAGDVHRSLRRRIAGSHMSLKTALNFFRANDMSRVQAIYLLHLSDGNSDAGRFKDEVAAVTGKPVYVC